MDTDAYKGLNELGKQRLKDAIFRHCKNPEDHCLEAWEDSLTLDEDFVWLEIRAFQTTKGIPVVLQFYPEEWK